jgi:Concanavalin A-like lectin/glucanases superfamily
MVPALADTIMDLNFNGTLQDSSGNGNDATVLTGNPSYSSNVPVSVLPQTGMQNIQSLSLASGDSLMINSAFAFQSQTNATLQFWVDPSSVSSEQDLIWTTNGSGDTNRFNIGIGTGGSFFADYRSPDGTLNSIGGTAAGLIVAGQWTLLALVKSGSDYTLYVNDVAVATGTATGALPDSTGWTINGRGPENTYCCQYTGLLDEVLISDQALAPSQFENVPEPSSLVLIVAALGILAVRRGLRRQPAAAEFGFL